MGKKSKSKKTNVGGVQPATVVELLSTASTLVEVNFPSMAIDDVEEIPAMNLPKLKFLNLERAPRSAISGDSKTFFKNLITPQLEQLWTDMINPKDLSGLKKESAPQSIFATRTFSGTEEDPEKAATSLLKSMKDWNQLKELRLFLPPETSANFWNHLIRSLAFLSKGNIQAGYKSDLLLPNFRNIVLGGANSEPSESPMSGSALLALISRRMVLELGLSAEEFKSSQKVHFKTLRVVVL